MVYQSRTLSPLDRALIDNIFAENKQLKEIIEEQNEALMELAEIIAEGDEENG